MSAPATKRGVPDLDHAEAQAEKAVRALDQAMAGYGHRHRHDLGYMALRSAMGRVEDALEEIRKDKVAIHE